MALRSFRANKRLDMMAEIHVESLMQLRRRVIDMRMGTIPLLEALRLSWRAESTDPRHKVYGLLGLASDARKYAQCPAAATLSSCAATTLR